MGKIQLSYIGCGVMVAALLVNIHMDRYHGLIAPQTRVVDEVGGVLATYAVSLTWVLNTGHCPVPGCPYIVHIAGWIH